MKFESVNWDVVYAETAPDLLIAFVESNGLDLSEHRAAQYPGGRHWHLKSPGAKGVVEVTWWPDRRRLWVHQRANRRGVWTSDAIEKLVNLFGAE